MLPVLQPAQLGRELAACTILGAAVGVVRAFFPVRGRGAFVPDALLTGAVLFGVQSYAAALSSAGVLRWYMVLAAFAIILFQLRAKFTFALQEKSFLLMKIGRAHV